MAGSQSSNTLKQYAAELRKIAVDAKYSWSRNVAEKMADEYERKAAASAINEIAGTAS